jgi:hypothetical protein
VLFIEPEINAVGAVLERRLQVPGKLGEDGLV